MKHINLAGSSKDIEIVFEIPTDELVKDTLQSTILARIPEQYHHKIFFADFVNYDKYNKVKALPNVKIVLSPDKEWAKHLPHITYKYDSRALFLAVELEKLEKALLHLNHYLEHGEFLVTQVKRKGFYPRTKEEVRKAFQYLHKFPVLGSDIEATSLKFYEAELVSISFAVSEAKGFTFHVKRCDFEEELVKFFKEYQGRIVWHNGSYDIKVLTFMYFNGDSRELYRTFEDTQFLHFMCTNSPERPERNLGALGKDLCGEYKLTKKEITDMMNVDVGKVCRYNLDDARATLWLYKTYRTKIYSEYFYGKLKKWQWALTQMELTGLPYKVQDLEDAKTKVQGELTRLTKEMENHEYVEKTLDILQVYDMEKYNATHVGDKELWDIPRKKFNPNSSTQVKILFEKVIGVQSPLTTPSGNPSYGVKSYPHLKLLLENNPEAEQLMDLLEEYSGYNQLFVTFLKPMLGNSWVRDNGRATLHGSFNLARVVSGRLSSSDPNLQNLKLWVPN